MPVNYLEAPGDLIDKETLHNIKAIEVVRSVEELDYYSLVECRRIDALNAEVIVFDAEVEIGQKTVHDIRKIERLAVIFSQEDTAPPEVLALREDFPRVPHLNLRLEEKPRSLCLYDEAYAAVKLHWTAALFLERIRNWLSLTARGELHATDQPLEPLLSASSFLIYDDISSGDEKKRSFMIVKRQETDWVIANSPESFIVFPLVGEPQTHGIISRQPKTVFDLHNFLLGARVDLLGALRSQLLNIKTKETDKSLGISHLVLLVYLPKKRAETSSTETADIWAFLVNATIKQIGIEIGIWEIIGGEVGTILEVNTDRNGSNLTVDVLNPTPSFTKEIACISTGRTTEDHGKFVLIGCGALGSHIFIDLIRMGYGNWTLIDDDCLLPHNLARHALPGIYVGRPKAASLADMANNMISGEPTAKAINADILHPFSSKTEIEEAYKAARIIIDVSTSIPVARYLTQDVDSFARRISLFLNPTGTDVVMLAEDDKRSVPLDCLEMQYYRHLISVPTMNSHLRMPEGHIRYARSCRDISSVIPQDLVALHSAICARAIRNVIPKIDAHIQIWTTTEDMDIKHHVIQVAEVQQIRMDQWSLYVDQYVIDKIARAREEKLPNETGGVLLGSFDMQRKIVYVVDTIISPPDSLEWPTVYIRGCQGLKKQVDEVKRITAEMLDYIGEWHSHPQLCSTRPSSDDVKAFSWLVEMMAICGFPALMLIAGDHPQYSWYLGRME